MPHIMIRIFRQMFHDKRSLALLLIAPLFVLTLLYFILGDSGYKPKIAVYKVPEQISESLAKTCTIKTLSKPLSHKNLFLKSNHYDGYIYLNKNNLSVYLLEKNETTAKVLTSFSSPQKNVSSKAADYHVSYAYSSDSTNKLNSYGFVFLGILSFFFVFILSGIAFVSEKNTQTLERMLMSPLSRLSVILGYTLGYGVLCMLQSSIMILFCAYVLHLTFRGSILLCMLIMTFMSFASVETGMLLSLFADNDFQMIQFIPIIVIPQIFFSGLISIDSIPFHLGNLKYITPAYYACFALKHVMVYQDGFSAILPYLSGLFCYIVVFYFLNVLALKKYRIL